MTAFLYGLSSIYWTACFLAGALIALWIAIMVFCFLIPAYVFAWEILASAMERSAAIGRKIQDWWES